MPSEPAPASNGTACRDCGGKVVGRGFCIRCYYKHKKAGDLGKFSAKVRHRITNVNAAGGKGAAIYSKKCRGRRGQTYYTWVCVTPRNARSRDYKRAYRESKKQMLGPECEICGSRDRLRWDHDHNTGKFRGTLCDTCNMGVGLFYNDPALLRAAAEYLEE